MKLPGKAGLRTVAALGIALAAPVHAAELAFDVLLDGKPIGTHTFLITPQGDAERVESTAKFDLKVIGIRLYRYRHVAEEQWQRGCLQRLAAHTDDNGEKLTVTGEQADAGFQLQQPKPELIRADCVATFAYWNLDRLRTQQRLLNPQSGNWEAARLESLGDEDIESRGVKVPARHHRLHAGELVIDLWYSRAGEWLQLRSAAKGNRQLLYRRRD